MITNREIENLLSGHWKSLTRSQQVLMAQELMTYRKARAEFQPGWGDCEIAKRKAALGQEMDDYENKD
jgi:hypothetical protein